MITEEEFMDVMGTACNVVSDLCQKHGVKFEYKPETSALQLLCQDGSEPNAEAAIALMVFMASSTMACAFELSAYSTREQPLKRRHTELHRLFMMAGDALGIAYEEAAGEASRDIEIARALTTH